MFRALCAHHQEVKLYYTASGIFTLCRWSSGAPDGRLHSDDTSCCIIKLDLLMMSTTVLESYRGIPQTFYEFVH